jgi:hypothetical protein
MTDIPADELFPHSGPVRPVRVESRHRQGAFSVLKVESDQAAGSSTADNNSANAGTREAKPSNPSNQDSFAARLAKVKRQTVDTNRQLENIKFTDQ